MSQKITFYPLGNAETCLLELSNGTKFLFDYANMNNGSISDDRIDLKKELSEIEEFQVVMFSHAHDDHTRGAGDYFYFDHAEKYQSADRVKIKELWVSSAFIMDTDLENESDAKIIRSEARHRLKEGYGIRVFSEANSLSTWAESQGISYDDIEDFLVHAGQLIEEIEFGGEVKFFVHAPFTDDCDEVQDKNDPSIVLQIQLYNYNINTNVIVTGDTNYKILDKIVSISKANGNEEYLKWDIYDIPHHCSYTGLNEKSEDNTYRFIPSENVQWILKQAQKNAKMVASCDKITPLTSPPHLIAKRAYEYYTNDDVKFMSTMEHFAPQGGKPTPIIFEIDNLGITQKSDNPQAAYLKTSAPRAGY